MSVVDFLSEDQEMEVAENVEIMEVSEDVSLQDENGQKNSILLIHSTEKSKPEMSNANEIGAQIIDLAEIENNSRKYDYLQDSSNIIGKNFSAILNSNDITEKRLLEILNEGEDCADAEVAMDAEDDDSIPKSEAEDGEEIFTESKIICNNVTNININDNNGNKDLTNDNSKSDSDYNKNNNENDNTNLLNSISADCNNNNDDKSKITITINAVDNEEGKDNTLVTINNNNNNNNININAKNTKLDKHHNEVNKKYTFDPDLAVNHLQEKCDLGDLLEIERRVLLQPVEVLCHSDKDGDTPLMIIVSKTLEESSKLYENIFAMQERLMNIRMCCQKPIEDFLDCCPKCGSSNEDIFLTPLSCKNNIGDTALTCAMKMEHSEMIINYLLSGISRNENDVRKIFDKNSIGFYQEQVRYYPSLLRFLQPPRQDNE